MRIKLRRVGNSFGIIMPKHVLDLLNLKENDEIDINIKNRRIELILTKSD